MQDWNNPWPIEQSSEELDGGCGRKVYLVALRATSTYWAINSQKLRTLKLATTCIVGFKLTAARIFWAYLPPWEFSLRPHCQLGIYPWQWSQVTRAATFPQFLHQWIYGKELIDGIVCLNGFCFLFFCVHWVHILACWLLSQCFVFFGFGKLAELRSSSSSQPYIHGLPVLKQIWSPTKALYPKFWRTPSRSLIKVYSSDRPWYPCWENWDQKCVGFGCGTYGDRGNQYIGQTYILLTWPFYYHPEKGL